MVQTGSSLKIRLEAESGILVRRDEGLWLSQHLLKVLSSRRLQTMNHTHQINGNGGLIPGRVVFAQVEPFNGDIAQRVIKGRVRIDVSVDNHHGPICDVCL